MSYSIKDIKLKILNSIPLLLLIFISLNGNSIINFKFFTINLHYILIYYWVLRRPQALGYGFIFLSGIITDVIFGLPIGVNALTLLVIASVAAYVRVVTVRISLFYDWMTFIPALLFANFIYFIVLYFSEYSVDYLYLFTNSIFTFIFYPALWLIFGLLINISKQGTHV